MKPVYLECQQCGDNVRELSQAEQQKVANDPYNFVAYCRHCKKDLEKELGIS